MLVYYNDHFVWRNRLKLSKILENVDFIYGLVAGYLIGVIYSCVIIFINIGYC